MTGKTYEINSFEDICNVVNEENFERFMLDFMTAFGMYMTMVNKVREELPDETKGKTNWEVSKYHFNWVDDGKNDLKSITIKGPDSSITHKEY